jgi:hypothetical protein
METVMIGNSAALCTSRKVSIENEYKILNVDRNKIKA